MKSNKKSVKVVGVDTNEVYYFNSMFAAAQYLGCYPCWITWACDDPTGKKDVLSKINRRLYHCYYVKPEDLPENVITSFDARTNKVSDERSSRHRFHLSNIMRILNNEKIHVITI